MGDDVGNNERSWMGEWGVTRVSVVSVAFESVFALCNGEVIFGNDLVEGVGAPTKGLASVAVAIGGKVGQRVWCDGCGELDWGEDGGWRMRIAHQRTWAVVSSLAVHSVWPQWHFPLKVVIVRDSSILLENEMG